MNKKLNDWWARHNVTTRTILFVTLILFAATILKVWLGGDVKHFDKIMDILSQMLLWLTALIIGGINGASTLMDKYGEIVKGKNDA